MKTLVSNKSPWEDNLYSLVSLYEMLQFYADEFMRLVETLGRLDVICREQKQSNPGRKIKHSKDNVILECIKALDLHCEYLGLVFSRMQIERFSDLPEEEDIETFGERVRVLRNRIYDEMKIELFMHITKEKAKYYKEPWLSFGQIVVEKFPSASHDIEEAGKCFAAGRNTACVFHVMRVFEAGLNCLANVFQVPFENTNWEKILNQIEAAIRQIEKDPNKPANWKDERQFYSEAANHFRFLKDAWRNYAMHIHERYDEESALNILVHGQAFMRHLTTKLSES